MLRPDLVFGVQQSRQARPWRWREPPEPRVTSGARIYGLNPVPPQRPPTGLSSPLAVWREKTSGPPAPKRTEAASAPVLPPPPALPFPTITSYHQEMLTTEMRNTLCAHAKKLLGNKDHMSTVTVLVEMNCREGLATMRHEKQKYERYYEKLRDALGGIAIVSPTGRHRINVIVGLAPPLLGAPMVVDVGGLVVTLPSNQASVDAKKPRLGAFEVFLIHNIGLSEEPGVSAHLELRSESHCSLIFSKLLTRRWPNVAALAKRCQVRAIGQSQHRRLDASHSHVCPHCPHRMRCGPCSNRLRTSSVKPSIGMQFKRFTQADGEERV